MRSGNRRQLKEAGDLLEAFASALAPLAALERRLRVFAAHLRDEELAATKCETDARPPKPTVAFSEIDSARADRALARLGVRKTR
jgi:hypothetical protein